MLSMGVVRSLYVNTFFTSGKAIRCATWNIKPVFLYLCTISSVFKILLDDAKDEFESRKVTAGSSVVGM